MIYQRKKVTQLWGLNPTLYLLSYSDTDYKFETGKIFIVMFCEVNVAE